MFSNFSANKIMQVLICLKVKYGFPINALSGFLENSDHQTWNNFLNDLTYEICGSQEDGQIYLLLKNCSDLKKIKAELGKLPLLQEEFLELKVHVFSDFKTLDNMFTGNI